ncbi:MAG: hypothetical protein ABI789_14645 [Usitatibacter sp.]
MNRLLATTLFCATSALAGPFDQPYSVIEVDRMQSADSHLRRVVVNRVDDENSVDNRAVVAPGAHRVTLDLPPRKGFHTATQHTFELATEPCMRYYVAARLESPTLQEWQPVVRYSEPIGECRARFHMAAGAR